MIIGVCGPKGSGKSEVSKYIQREHGFKPANMKDALISEMRDTMWSTLDALATHYNESVDWLFENKPPIMRELMQNYGTELRRGDDPDHWVKPWVDTVREGGNFVADDIRFTNELNALRAEGGLLIRVAMPGLEVNDNHKSEKEHESFEEDFMVVSEKGSLHTLQMQVEDIMRTLKENTD